MGEKKKKTEYTLINTYKWCGILPSKLIIPDYKSGYFREGSMWDVKGDFHFITLFFHFVSKPKYFNMRMYLCITHII